MAEPRCFKCGKEVECAVKDPTEEDRWNVPCGVSFRGGGNYGSTVYDALVDGISVQILVCDDCLRANKDVIRELKTR